MNHFEYDAETKELSLLHKNIHLQNNNINNVTKFQFEIQHLLDNLKIGDLIDVQDSHGYWYLAKVLKIKDEKYYNRDIKHNDNTCTSQQLKPKSQCSSLVIKSMMIFVHYIKWVDNKYDKWINVTSNIEEHIYEAKQNNTIVDDCETIVENTSSLCDCIDKCVYKTHKISIPRQSLYEKSLKGFRGLYSKYHNTMIILGKNLKYRHSQSFEGIYCKQVYIGKT